MITLTETPQGLITVRFTEYDLAHAGMAGFFRQVKNQSRGLKDAYGFRGDGWGAHINGALGEAAVACYLDRFWSIGVMRGTDVHQYQVRTTMSEHVSLILHPGDADDQIFFLVRATPPDFTIHGWLPGAGGKQQRYWGDPAGGRPAFFVPAAALRPLSDFDPEVAT